MTTEILMPPTDEGSRNGQEDGVQGGRKARKDNESRGGRKDHARRPRSPHRHAGLVWTAICLIVAVSLSIGLCALFLPDRAPALLQAAPEVTSAPVSSQMYSDSRQVTLLPRRAADRSLLSNTSGMVTGSPASTLTSGKAAMSVDGRPVIALATSVPVYRNLAVGDSGTDVSALNTELRRLGYAAPAGTVFTQASKNAWGGLIRAAGGNATDFKKADVLWIPASSVAVTQWTAVLGGTISEGDKIGVIPGALQRLDIRGGQSFTDERRLSVYGQSITLPAGSSSVSDAGFCAKVAANPQFSSMSEEQAAAGITATVSLPKPIRVLRVPAGAVFGISGSHGCIARPGAHSSGNVPLRVEIVGGQIGVSLVRMADSSDPMPSRVALGSSLAHTACR